MEPPQALACILLLSIGCHWVYRKYEPRRLPWHFVLLVVIPILLGTPLFAAHSSSLILAAVEAWIVYTVCLATSVSLYRLSPFHPLAKYPGPIACKLTKIWFAYKAWGGKQHLYYYELHQKYGDVVRIGPNELSFCTPEVVVPMLGSAGMPKAAYWDGQFAEETSGPHRSLIGQRNVREHARRRKIWSRAFSSDALKTYYTHLCKRVSQLAESLDRHEDTPMDLAKWISWFSYDFMNDMAFGWGEELMQSRDMENLCGMMDNSQRGSLLLAHLPWLVSFHKWIPPTYHYQNLFRAFGSRRITRRITDGSPSKDLFYYLMDEAGFEPERPPIEQVAGDTLLAIVAGADTVAPALSHLFWLLLCNPKAHKRLQTELDESKASSDDFNGLAQLPYLNAVINEALRMMPPVLSGSMRSPKIGSGGHMLGDHFIPEGTTTNVHIYSLHRDERNFSHPALFLPERWLEEKERQALEPRFFGEHRLFVHNASAFIPFSYGPADCIGKRLAMQELRSVVCAIVDKFDLTFEKGFKPQEWEDEVRDFLVTVKGRLPVILRRRV